MLTADFRVWILLVALAHAGSTASIPASSITTICKRSDPNLDACAMQSTNELRGKLDKGIKQIKFPPLEPLVIPRLEISQGEGPVNLNLVIIDMAFKGISKFQLKNLHIDLANREIDVEALVPSIETEGNYEVDGKVLALPITGKGVTKSKYSDVFVTAKMKFKQENKKGKEHWKLENSNLDLDVKHADIHLGNLFNGNKQLGDTMNQFIAENWREVFRELKPTLAGTMNEFIKMLTQRVFDAYSFDELFPE